MSSEDLESPDWIAGLRQRVDNGEITIADEFDLPESPTNTENRLLKGFNDDITRRGLGRYHADFLDLASGKLTANALWHQFTVAWAARRPWDSFLLLGGEGVGKSVCALAACHSVAMADMGWGWIDAVQIVEFSDSRTFDRIDALKRVHLCVIDEPQDLIQVGGKYLALLKAVLRYRYRSGAPTICCSALNKRDLSKKLGADLVSQFEVAISSAEPSNRPSIGEKERAIRLQATQPEPGHPAYMPWNKQRIEDLEHWERPRLVLGEETE